MSEDVTMQATRAELVRARGLVGGVGDLLWQLDGPGLADVLGELDALEVACAAAKVAVVGEAVQRGETTGGAAALSPVQ
jgi:hypothetical protein